MEPLFELAIRLPPRRSRSLLRSLHRQLRAAIADGRLRPGLQLPATRALATQLGIGRNTVIAAYDLLISEGYLVARGGSGTYVGAVRPASAASLADWPAARETAADRRIAARWRRRSALSYPSLARKFRYEFHTGTPDLSRFPFDVWQRLSARVTRALARERIVLEQPQGRQMLREAIARHVSFTRAVACRSDDIIVTSGTRQSLDLLARILVTPGKTAVAIEDPVYTPVRLAFEAAEARVAAIAVDAEGLVVERLSPRTQVIYVSPSHQFPLGVAMSARRRAALLDFAQAHRAVIIEDDYDSEFRLQGRPLDALQTLDRSGSVFYVGTFSKSLFPALRLGFIVSPPWARQALVAAKQLADGHCPVLAQDTLAAFIAEGHLARHLRRMRKLYAERHALLLDALARYCAGRLRPVPAVAGLHLAAHLTGSGRAANIARHAHDAGIRVETLDSYAHRRPAPNGLVFGYGTVVTADIAPAIRRLARLLD
jgi:GntR family transcriptional regulator / MocR family aminotransferase